jgi:hypothetical protein
VKGTEAGPILSRGSLVVDVEPNAAGLDADELRDAISREAGVRVTSSPTNAGAAGGDTDARSGATRLVVRSGGAHALRFELIDPSGRRVERAIELPEEGGVKARDTAALVAASLLEDEAAALLAALRAESAKPPVEDLEPPPTKKKPRLRLVPPLHACSAYPERPRKFGADFAPYIGTSAVQPPGTVRSLSLQFFGGHEAGVEGVEVAPVVALGGEFVCGVQVAGLAAWVSGPVRGVAFAGGLERATRADGVVFGGLGSLASDVTGVQFGGFGTWADSIRGVQFSGFGAVTVHTVTGVQAAGLSMADEIHGLQLGAIDIAGAVYGAQIGIVDVARTSDVSVGLVTIVVEGRTHLQAFASSDGVATLALQHGSRWVHNFYGGSVSFGSDKPIAAGPLVGVGVHVPIGPRAFVDVDLISHLLFDPNRSVTPQSQWQGRVIAGVELAPGFSLFAGPSYQALLVPTGQTPNVHPGFVLKGSGNIQTDATVYAWPGLVAGMQLL